MKQRAICQKLVEITLEFGIEYHDGKVILNRQGLQVLIKELKAMEHAAQKAADKGGLVVVRAGDTLVTTYRLDSFSRRAGRNNAMPADGGDGNPGRHEEGGE
jgi:hypothetical protein